MVSGESATGNRVPQGMSRVDQPRLEPAGARPGPAPVSRRLRFRRATVFVIAASLPTWMALEGGAYDIVIRQEIGMLIWSLVAITATLSFIPRGQIDRHVLWPLLGVGAFLALNVLSLAWTGSAERTVDEVARIVVYGGVIVLGLLSVNRYTWRAAAGGLSTALALVAILAVVTRLLPDTFETANEIGSDRLYYPFGYWNAVACWGAMAIASGLAWSAHARSTLVRGLAMASVPFAIACVYLTYSRGGVAAASVAVLAVILFARNRWTAAIHTVVAALAGLGVVLVIRGQPEVADGLGSGGAGTVALVLIAAGVASALCVAATAIARADRLRLPRNAAITASIAGVLVLVVGVLAAQGPLSEAVDEFKDGEDPAATAASDPASRLSSVGGARYDYWETAGDAFSANPILGIGPGTYEFYWAEHGSRPEFVVDAHSLYLEQLAELGLIGFAVLLAFLAALAGAAWQARQLRGSTDGADAAMFSVAAVWAVYSAIDWVWEITAITAVALAAVAISIAGASGRRRQEPSLGLRAAIVGVALVCIAIQVPGIVSHERSRAAETARLSGDPAAAIALASEAADATPWAATPLHTRALAEFDAGKLAAADQDVLDAIDREPDNRWHWLLATRVAIARDRPEQAEARLEDAIRINGKLPLLNRSSFLRAELRAQIAQLEAPPASLPAE